jgi:DNA-binding CsgD family transcriptional regulator
MALNNLRFRIPNTSETRDHAAQKFSQLQTDLVSTAQMWAVDEVSAVMARQLNEPLTALLTYLNEIKKEGSPRAGEEPASDLIREMVDKALFETERVCSILERLDYVTTEDGAADIQSAIEPSARPGDLIATGPALMLPRAAEQYSLTPREAEVLALITAGASNKEGGYRLGISTRTFEVHRAHIMKKCGARNAADLVRITFGEVR